MLDTVVLGHEGEYNAKKHPWLLCTIVLLVTVDIKVEKKKTLYYLLGRLSEAIMIVKLDV